MMNYMLAVTKGGLIEMKVSIIYYLNGMELMQQEFLLKSLREVIMIFTILVAYWLMTIIYILLMGMAEVKGGALLNMMGLQEKTSTMK